MDNAKTKDTCIMIQEGYFKGGDHGITQDGIV